MDKRTLLFMICVSLAFFGVQFYFGGRSGSQDVKPVQAIVHVEKPKLLVQNAPISTSQEGTLYVLENEYQQLVFSTRGGSLAEINLPLKSAKNSKSYVKEIDFDRNILATSPQNARFPLMAYETPDNGHHDQGTLGGYYPLMRRGINGKSLSAEYYAFNIIGDDPNIANATFRMTRFEPNLIQFQGSVGQAQITKTYTIPKERNGPYCLNLEIQVDGDASGLWLSSGVPDVEIVSNSYSPLLRIQTTKNKISDVDTIDLPKKGPIQVDNLSPNWISNCNGFLGLIMDPLSGIGQGYRTAQIDGALVPTRLTLIDSAYNLYPADSYPGYATYLPLKTGTMSFRIFAGPYDTNLLKELDALYEDPTQHYNPDYVSALSLQGWFSFISQPFAKFLFFLMELFYAVTRSWAVSIILLTVALRAMMYPLNSWSISSTAKMQALAPKVEAIKEKYKKDPKRAQLETMNLYRESGANPLTGCLPVLLQMPFLIGMFYLLKSSFPLRGAVFIPGWIDDLSAPDVLFSWGQPIWFIGHDFHLLPILMGLTMFLQQKFTSKLPKDASQLTDAQKQQKMMGNMMSVLFMVMFYNFPSGLNIYFMLSTLLGVAQQAWMMKKMQSTPKKA
ncbi:MAG TPA: membrane protein insertase YidC [Chlamydiales bacterium]|nr:membrane protein insertase YidC [Chlamydiales bacterium]